MSASSRGRQRHCDSLSPLIHPPRMILLLFFFLSRRCARDKDKSYETGPCSIPHRKFCTGKSQSILKGGEGRVGVDLRVRLHEAEHGGERAVRRRSAPRGRRGRGPPPSCSPRRTPMYAKKSTPRAPNGPKLDVRFDTRARVSPAARMYPITPTCAIEGT
jgi:hypothetical protein